MHLHMNTLLKILGFFLAFSCGSLGCSQNTPLADTPQAVTVVTPAATEQSVAGCFGRFDDALVGRLVDQCIVDQAYVFNHCPYNNVANGWLHFRNQISSLLIAEPHPARRRQWVYANELSEMPFFRLPGAGTISISLAQVPLQVQKLDDFALYNAVRVSGAALNDTPVAFEIFFLTGSTRSPRLAIRTRHANLECDGSEASNKRFEDHQAMLRVYNMYLTGIIQYIESFCQNISGN